MSPIVSVDHFGRFGRSKLGIIFNDCLGTQTAKVKPIDLIILIHTYYYNSISNYIIITTTYIIYYYLFNIKLGIKQWII